jgi:hypothetical protein
MANGEARDRRDQPVSARNPLRKGQRPPISSVMVEAPNRRWPVRP